MSTTPTRPLPPEVRDKLGKLLPLLSSEHNGERVGAVAAIERVLKSNDRDWHDLVALITTAAPVREPPRRQARRDDNSDTMDAEELVDLDHQATRQRRHARVPIGRVSRWTTCARPPLRRGLPQRQAATMA